MPVIFTNGNKPKGTELTFSEIKSARGFGQWIDDGTGHLIYYWSTWMIDSTLDLGGDVPAGGRIIAQGNNGADTLYGGAGADYLDGGAGNDSLVSTQGNDTLNGGTGDDWIRTTTWTNGTKSGGGRDIIDGGDGNDTILVESADNVITGGTGNDLINATAGGRNQLDGGEGNDTIKAGSDNDTILGGAGSDSISTGGGADKVEAGDGNDTIDATDSRGLVINGDGGNDLIIVPATVSSGIVNGGGGNDTIDGRSPSGVNSSRDYSLDMRGGAGNDLLFGGGAADTADGGGGADTVDLGGGDDRGVWFYGDGADSYNGGSGNDTLWINFQNEADFYKNLQQLRTLNAQFTGGSVESSFGGVRFKDFEILTISIGGRVRPLDSAGGPATDLYLQPQPTDGADTETIHWVGKAQDPTAFLNGLAGDDIYIMASRKESVIPQLRDAEFNGGGGNDTMVGNDRDDRMRGGTGDDLLLGDSGNDTLYGDSGHDSIDGGAGNDLLGHGYGTAGRWDSSTLNGGGGNDTLYGGAADLLQGGDGNDRIFGGSGPATAMGGNGDDLVVFDASAPSAGNASLSGGSGSDTLLAGAGADTLDGGADADSLSGFGGNDLLIGGAGSDTLSGGDGADTLQGGTGIDSVSGGGGGDVLLYSRDAAYTGGYYDVLTGNAGSYVVRLGSDDKNDPSNFGLTQDIYDGGEGLDTLVGTDARDALFFQDQTGRQQIVDIEAFNMGAGDDVIDLTGSAQAALVFGGAGSDLIAGGVGADTILGGSGSNTLFGGGGEDRFVFSSAASSGTARTDTILDFKQGDEIWLTSMSDTFLERRGASMNLGNTLHALRLTDLNANGMVDDPDGARLTLKSGDSIKIAGVSVTNLERWNILT